MTDTLAPDLTADLAWRDFLTSSRRLLVDELVTTPRPLGQREADLFRSIMLIDRSAGRLPAPIVTLTGTLIGELMVAKGYVIDGPDLHSRRGWQGSLKDVQKRIDKGVTHEVSTPIAR